MPTAARGSVPVITFTTSPIPLITSSPIATRYPHQDNRHKPIAATAQAQLTEASRIGPHKPRLESPTWARGLSCHIGSRKLPGASNDIAVVPLIAAPTAKKTSKCGYSARTQIRSFRNHSFIFVPSGVEVQGKRWVFAGIERTDWLDADAQDFS